MTKEYKTLSPCVIPDEMKCRSGIYIKST